MGERAITLRNERVGSGSHHLRARYDDSRIVIEGQDLGSVPQSFWGAGEYEWAITIEEEAVPRLVAALGGAAGDDPLDLLEARVSDDERYATTAFLDQARVPYEFWSRVGD